MNKKDQENLDNASRTLLKMGPVRHKRPPKKPTKKELERKFKMNVDQKGKPSIEEVE